MQAPERVYMKNSKQICILTSMLLCIFLSSITVSAKTKDGTYETYDNHKYYSHSTMTALAKYTSKRICACAKTIRVKYQGSKPQQALQEFSDVYDNYYNKFMSRVYSIDKQNNPDDGDVQMLYIENYQIQVKSIAGTGEIYVTIRLNYGDLTVEKMDLADLKIQKTIKKLQISKSSNKSDYAKVKAIHDWIINNCDYDHSLTHTLDFDGLYKTKTFVCTGYSIVFKKLCDLAGLKSRIMCGETSEGSMHAWNLVKVDGAWYFVDCTYDDLGFGLKPSYQYFLKCADTFLGDPDCPRLTYWKYYYGKDYYPAFCIQAGFQNLPLALFDYAGPM